MRTLSATIASLTGPNSSVASITLFLLRGVTTYLTVTARMNQSLWWVCFLQNQASNSYPGCMSRNRRNPHPCGRGPVRDDDWQSVCRRPGHKASRTVPRISPDWSSQIQPCEPPSPAKPMNASDNSPANIRLIAAPWLTAGTSASSNFSRRPAISISAKVKPAPAPMAYTTL